MSKRAIVIVLVVLALLSLLASVGLQAAVGRPGRAYTLTVRLAYGTRLDMIISRCTARQPGRLLVLHTDITHGNRLTDTRTRVLLGSWVAAPCPYADTMKTIRGTHSRWIGGVAGRVTVNVVPTPS